jgi:peptidyl-prolyl cis-trans isomerase D
MKEFVMDRLIERELFASEAERLGYNVSNKEAEDQIYAGKMIVGGIPRRVEGYVYKDGKFDYERFKMISQNQLGVTVQHFIEIQKREMLADKMREALRVAAKVAPDEVKQEFESRGLQVNLEYGRFPERRYEEEVAEATPAEVDAYVKAHEAELKKQYDERAFLYKNLDKQAKLRHILVEAPKDLPQDQTEAARTKATNALTKIKAGTSFATVAKDVSNDDRTKGRGGEMGWRKKGFTGFGEAVEKKIFESKPGTLVGPERTERGFELVEVEGFREGDVPLAEAEKEMAADEVRKGKAKDKARADAQAVVDRVKKGEKLDTILPKEETNPNESPEERQIKALMKKASEPVHLQETGLFSRRGEMIQDIGISKELAKRAFELKSGEAAGPFDVGSAWVVVRVKEHHDPDLADFEKRKGEIIREYERTKWAELVDNWSKQKCAEVRDDGRIKVNGEVLEYEVGGKSPVAYQPCSAKGPF